jgi:hypothetical protein
MNEQKDELKKLLSNNKLLHGKRVEFIPLGSITQNKWLFTIDGEIKNIEHFLSAEEIALLNEVGKTLKF